MKKTFSLCSCLKSLFMSLPIFSEVMAVAERLQTRIFSGMDSADAWNEVSVDLGRCAKVNLI